MIHLILNSADIWWKTTALLAGLLLLFSRIFNCEYINTTNTTQSAKSAGTHMKEITNWPKCFVH